MKVSINNSSVMRFMLSSFCASQGLTIFDKNMFGEEFRVCKRELRAA